MARIAKPLNPTQVTQAKPKAKVYNLADGGGLYLRIKPNGSKLWIFNYYKPFTKKRSDISLGSFPDVSLATAREKRGEYRTLLAASVDPKLHREEVAAKQAESQSNTFKVIAEKWIEIHRTKVTKNTADKMWRSLDNHIFPKLGKIPIDCITAPQAIEVLQNLVRREKYEMARMVAQRMNSVMTFAVNAGLIHHNALVGIKQMIPSNKVRNMPSLRPEELPELMRALNFAQVMLPTRCLIEWQLHTMCRPGEAATTKWAEINFDESLWIIPASKMKMGREHIVPLSSQSVALLEIMKPISGHREYVFPSHRNPKSHASKETANTALKRMGFKNRLVAHGLRSLASTTLNEQGFDYDLIEAALSHGDSDKIRSAYNRATYVERRKSMMTWWSDFIDAAASGSLSLANSEKHLRLVNG